MRRERVVQAGTCHHLVARVAKGESKGARRYDKESLLWQSTVAVKSDPVGPELTPDVWERLAADRRQALEEDLA